MNPRPLLAGTIVAVLVAGIAVAVVRPGDLGDDGRSDAARPTTTTAPADQAAPAPRATDVPETTTPAASPPDGAGGTATTAPSPVPTTAPVPGTPSTAAPTAPTTTSPAPPGPPAPAPADGPAAETRRPPTLADTGGSDVLVPLAVVLLVAGTVGRLALRPSAPSPRFWRQQRSGN